MPTELTQMVHWPSLRTLLRGFAAADDLEVENYYSVSSRNGVDQTELAALRARIQSSETQLVMLLKAPAAGTGASSSNAEM